MGKRDPRVDAYIAKAAEFAKPILTHVRETVHAACPDVEEAMKWSFPHFMYKGILCSMAAFTEHAAFGFWKASLIIDDRSRSADAMGQMGRLTRVSDLPPTRTLTGYIRKAAALNEAGVTVKRKPMRRASKAVLKKNKKAFHS